MRSIAGSWTIVFGSRQTGKAVLSALYHRCASAPAVVAQPGSLLTKTLLKCFAGRISRYAYDGRMMRGDERGLGQFEAKVDVV